MRRPLPLDRLQGLSGGESGLPAAGVEIRRRQYGDNDIIELPGKPWLDLVKDTARDPMIWFLVGTSVAYAVLGSYVEAATLLGAVLPLAAMDAYLHRRTRASVEGLSRWLATRARVIRGGATMKIPATEVVVGDLAVVRPNEPFPADGLVVAAENAQVDESALTGEAYPVRKHAQGELPAGGNAPLVEDEHWGFAGTRLLTGTTRLRVVFTGRETVYGEIVRSAIGGRHERTPLQKAITGLVAVLLAAAAVLCLILAAVRLTQGHGWLDAIISAATLAVAALPEEFPVVFTIFLGVGVHRLAKRRALVRRAVSVENVGRVSCICSDKTGTITEGRLRVAHLLPATHVDEAHLLELAALASRMESGDPLDFAILDAAAARRANLAKAQTLATYPFTEERRRETVIVKHRGELLAAVKGSPELVLPMCTLSDEEHSRWKKQVVALAGEGHKMIACASRPLDSNWIGGEPDRGYTLAGLLACEDAIRPGVPEAVRSCRDGAIRVLLITGDHPATARAVAREIGLGSGAPLVISGEDMQARLDAGATGLEGVDVIARAVPSQKLALVRALQGSGEIVAVTGDGVNDVPALQAANIGIAMGERGTRSAREVASIVLLDDNFRSIVHAIAEGRQLLRNLQLSFAYLLMIHVPLVITATLIPLVGYPLLYLPVHVVWLEAIIHPTAILVFQELPAAGHLEPASLRRDAGFFDRRQWMVIALVGAVATLAVALTYERSLGPEHDVAHARAMALALLTTFSAFLTATLSKLRTRAAWTVTGTTLVVSAVVIQVAPIARLLHLAPLHFDDWILAIALAGACAALSLLTRAKGAIPSAAYSPKPRHVSGITRKGWSRP